MMDFLAQRLLNEEDTTFDAYSVPPEIVSSIERWRTIHEPNMRQRFLTAEYEPVAFAGKVTAYPFLVPYGSFFRMTSYTFLTVCQFITGDSDREVRSRARMGLMELIRRYRNIYENDSCRYFSDDRLKPKLRGIHPWIEVGKLPESEFPDIGSTALLFASLCNNVLLRLILDDEGVRKEVETTRSLLLADLVDLFDRYLICPSFFRFSHALGVSFLLLVPIETHRLGDDLWRNFESAIEDLRFREGLSEWSISRFIEDHVFEKGKELPTHIFARSLSRLLLDETRPGRYPEGKYRFDQAENSKWVLEVVDQTLGVYQNPLFAQKFANAWLKSPMIDIAGSFVRSVTQREGKKILDVGSGPGQNAKLLQRAGLEVTLLDASSDMLELASNTLGRDKQDTLNLFMDIRDLSLLKTGSFDGIWCSGTMIHFPKPLAKTVIDEFRRILTDTGVLMVDCAVNNPRLVSNDGRFFAYWRNGDDFARLLAGAGFVIDSVTTSFVTVNTYNEPGLKIRWEDFLCSCRTSELTTRIPQTTALAYDLIVERFIDQHVSHLNRRLVQRICELMEMTSPSIRILDAGCGPGHYTGEFARRGFDATGVDLSTLMVSAAMKNYPECKFLVGDFADLPYPDEYFDCVFCMAAFQHIPLENDLAIGTLKGFRRVLKRNGILMLDVQLYRQTGFEPDGRFTQGYQQKERVFDLLDRAGFDYKESQDFKIPPGQNAFRRAIELTFCDFIATKRS